MFIIGLLVAIVLGCSLQALRTRKNSSKKTLLISVIIISFCYILGYLISKYNHFPGVIICN